MPLPLNIEVLDEGCGIEHCLLTHKARWHKSCNSKFNTTELKRAEKRLSSSSEEKDLCAKKHVRVFSRLLFQGYYVSFVTNPQENLRSNYIVFQLWK